jgi:putative ABC transport system substrate-binding protein
MKQDPSFVQDKFSIADFGLRKKEMHKTLRNRFLNPASDNNRKSKTCPAFDKLRPRACRGESSRRIQNRKLVEIVALVVTLAMSGAVAQAQQPGKVPRIGYVSGSGDANDPGPSVEAFRQGLRELGYIEGKNILAEYRYSEGKQDRMPSLVAELVHLKVDVLIFHDPSAIRAAKQATKTIPIVMVTTQDPVATGMVDSLARPGGNITGLTRLTRELGGKRMELLKEAVPGISRVGVLWVANPVATGNALEYYDAAARALKIPLQSLQVRGPNPDLEGAYRDAVKGRVSALISVTNQVLSPYRKTIADLAIKNRLPSMYEQSQYVEAGGLASYAANDADLFRRAAVYVDKILKGAKPTDLPVEQPTKFEFVINLKTAKALNLSIPQKVLVRADKVIR